MIAVDTNVLIYAHREELTQHAQPVAWLKALAEGPAPWGIPRILHRRIRARRDAGGNLAFDAQIVAVCREHGCDRLSTLDRDFARFKSFRTLSINDPVP